MKLRPCAIPDCPALTLIASSFCAVHHAMTELERTEARQAAERKREVPQLKRITDRIEYER